MRALNNSEFQEYLTEEVKKYKGIYVPVKAGILQRALIRNAPVTKLHPNPDDEFCSPKIGPNYEIISEYRQKIGHLVYEPLICAFGERIMVEKIRPDGYMILNGHHRWAAAIKTNTRVVPIAIVDLTQEEDVRKMFRQAKHDKRVSFDLDDVVFGRDETENMLEKSLHFPLNRIYKQRLRLGIPALFRFFGKKGYDIWVYSSNYYSMDYIRNLFRHYHVHVTGIVTGMGRKVSKDIKEREQLEKEFRELYAITIHADNQTLVRVDNKAKTYHEYPIKDKAHWTAEIMDIIREISDHERQQFNG